MISAQALLRSDRGLQRLLRQFSIGAVRRPDRPPPAPVAQEATGADVGEVYLVVAALPENFDGNQTYGFEYTIERQ